MVLVDAARTLGRSSVRRIPPSAMSTRIAVTPQHEIDLTEAWADLVTRPPDHDLVVRTLARREVNGQPLVTAELVVAGNDTREAYPRAREFPVHFRKSYYPICFFQNPANEFRNQEEASRIEGIGVAPPIGSTRTTFRACFVPGVALDRVSPFGLEPEERNIEVARDSDLLVLVGLWGLLEDLERRITALHAAGIAHGDLELHNVIVTRAPAGTELIDFENAVRCGEVDEAKWLEVCEADFREVLRLAVFVQCGLGAQSGSLADRVAAALEAGGLMQSPGRFVREIGRRSGARV